LTSYRQENVGGYFLLARPVIRNFSQQISYKFQDFFSLIYTRRLSVQLNA